MGDGFCLVCREPMTQAIRGRCNRCYQYRYALGKDRHPKLIEYEKLRSEGRRRCIDCREVKPYPEFYGLKTSFCKPCSRARARAYGQAHATPPRQAQCGFCRKGFETHQPNAEHCSTRCRRAAWKARQVNLAKLESDRRRALMQGAYVADVDRQEIFERDGWVCQLCHEPVDRSLVFPHKMAASLDHIVPLARGGKHEPSNTQLAHFICNSAKRDRTTLPRSA